MSQQQQQQQEARYDLLAVFPNESQATTATTKLKTEGFQNEEVHHIAADSVRVGTFRSHGPNQNRNEFFLQTQKARTNPAKVIFYAILFAIILGLATFAASFALPTLPEPITIILGIALGAVIGVIIGLMQRGKTRGAIGQEKTRVAAVSPPPKQQTGTARTVVALRFQDPEDISRTSRARAILLNNQGKIDRSVGR